MRSVTHDKSSETALLSKDIKLELGQLENINDLAQYPVDNPYKTNFQLLSVKMYPTQNGIPQNKNMCNTSKSSFVANKQAFYN